MEPSIVFDQVSKKFSRIYVSDSLRDAIAKPFKRVFGKDGAGRNRENKEFWALRDVEFEVKAGEALGIIGPNGSGKTTTLKLLSRILRPDGGRIMVKGRIGALIELGAGFNPDLTGRENIFLNAAILGMRREEISAKYDEIVEFAELEDFIDTPVKWYSTGMFARLGFAVAAHTSPQILLVDEVLSVGDFAFQKKCIEKMYGFKKQGVTVVFISHNMQTISSLCERTILLQKGHKIADGPTSEVVPLYLKKVTSAYREDTQNVAFFEAGTVYDQKDSPSTIFQSGQEVFAEVQIAVTKALPKAYATIWVQRQDNFFVFGVETYRFKINNFSIKEGQRICLKVRLTLNLVPGEYKIGASIFDVSDSQKEKAVFAEPFEDIIVTEATGCCGIAYLAPVLIDQNITKL